MTAAATTAGLTVRQAETMWQDLRGHFVRAEDQIAAIITARAWEPLGYDSFAAAWSDRMQGVRLATDAMRAQVVYAMLDSGMPAEEVAPALGAGSQVTARGVEALARQRANGVPASCASTRVRAHDRRRPGVRRTVHATFEPGEYRRIMAAAEARGLSVSAFTERAVRDALDGAL